LRLQRVSGALDLAQDFLAFGLPLVGLWVQVPLGQVDLDIFDQLPDAAKTAVPDDVLGQFTEEPLNKIEPGRTGRREVEVEAQMRSSPKFS